MLIANMLFIGERKAFGSLRARDHEKGLFRQSHRERVVDHPDDRVELSYHTFSLPVLLVPNDNSDHDHIPLSASLGRPPVL